MCDTCGCNVTPGNEHLLAAGGSLEHTTSGSDSVEVLKKLLEANDHLARHNRDHFDRHGVLAINLMSSPGAGKTSLLEATIDALAGRYGIAVIEGDLATENDAMRIRNKGITAIQITTGTACHLDAHMVHGALHELSLEKLDLVFIENVGNLVCPAAFDLGQHRNVTLLSSTEGDDKPAKYPVMFRASELMLISKSDLIPVLGDFDPARAESCLRRLANRAQVLIVSARDGTGLDDWCDWIDAELLRQRRRVSATNKAHPVVGTEHRAQRAASHGARR